MRLVREESGVTAIELLVAMSLLAVVLTATFRPLNAYERTASQNRAQNEAQGRARTTLDRLARELRNVAGQTQFVEKATASDLVYQTIDPLTAPSGTNSINLERVRYCLNSSTQRVWRQTQTWTTADPTVGALDGVLPRLGMDHAGGHRRPGDERLARRVHLQQHRPHQHHPGPHRHLHRRESDHSPAGDPASGGAYLRNQNKAPIAAFTAIATSNRHMTLNGSTSSDPEGGSITFKWFDGSTQIGTGQLCDCVALGTGNRTIKLEVMDPTGITDTATQTVKVK